jgi:hypothetical protein
MISFWKFKKLDTSGIRKVKRKNASKKETQGKRTSTIIGAASVAPIKKAAAHQ